MKKYIVTVTEDDDENGITAEYALLFDLFYPRYTEEWGLEFKLLDSSLPLNELFGEDFAKDCERNNGFMSIDDSDNIAEKCKIIEFESDNEAELWFELNYSNNSDDSNSNNDYQNPYTF